MPVHQVEALCIADTCIEIMPLFKHRMNRTLADTAVGAGKQDFHDWKLTPHHPMSFRGARAQELSSQAPQFHSIAHRTFDRAFSRLSTGAIFAARAIGPSRVQTGLPLRHPATSAA